MDHPELARRRLFAQRLAGAPLPTPEAVVRHTYMAFDARVPTCPAFDREAALARLARTYFASHGPASLKDFAWWSGLRVADAPDGPLAAPERAALATEVERIGQFLGLPARLAVKP
jgi:hypothetical protein